MYYIKYHEVNKISLTKTTYVDKWHHLAINGCATLKPLASTLGPLQTTHMTLHTINGALNTIGRIHVMTFKTSEFSL